MEKNTPVPKTLSETEKALDLIFGGSCDIVRRRFTVNRREALGVCADDLCGGEQVARTVIAPLTRRDAFRCCPDTAEGIRRFAFKGIDLRSLRTMEAAADAVLRGCYVLFTEGADEAFAFGAQAYAKKSVDGPSAEQTESGGQEGFTDLFKDNLSLLRRRLPTPALRIEAAPMPEGCVTKVFICYLTDRADGKTLKSVRERLAGCGLRSVQSSGWLRPFLDGDRRALFSGSGVTERPDQLAAKLLEGRVGVIADGSPFAVVVPYLFTDHFHSPDDYTTAPAYAFFIRALRFLCFAVAVGLPGIFTAVCVFHPKMLPADVLCDVAAAEAVTPFPLTAEAVTIHLIYEVVREAGLRMPRAAGHAVSIVGALVIGDAAVKAGLIAAPMLIVVGITTICSAVVSKLHDRVTVLRFALIAAGGFAGFYGFFLLFGLILTELSVTEPFGAAFSFPFAPPARTGQLDALLRAPWRRLVHKKTNGEIGT